MWTLNPTDECQRRFKKYEKKHPKELSAVLNNLDTYFRSLESGVKPLQIKHGFMHSEPFGVVAIDQKGGGTGLAQTRLYVYAESESEILHVITLGDKQSQANDIKTCRDYVTDVRKERADSHDKKD